MYVHGQTFGVRLTGYFRQFLLRPVRNALMTIGVNRFNKASAAFNCAVHEEFEPVCLDMFCRVFLHLYGILQSLVLIHPTLHFVSRA